ncbi:MAG: hypothetical protein ACFFC7_01620 [Candidatus Hermodarchaeota archaeon]
MPNEKKELIKKLKEEWDKSTHGLGSLRSPSDEDFEKAAEDLLKGKSIKWLYEHC